MKQILLVDDHAIVRTGLKLMIEEYLPEIAVQEAMNGTAALTKCKQIAFDMMVLDINMPNTDTLVLLNNIRVYRPDLPVLIFSMESSYAFLKPYLNNGVFGYLNKSSANSEIIQAIAKILDGKKYFSREILESIVEDRLFTPQNGSNPFVTLTGREMDITARLLRGESYVKIAEDLNIHVSTVGTHKSRIFGKLNVAGSIELLNLARLHGLLD